jgi:hypothetical protein
MSIFIRSDVKVRNKVVALAATSFNEAPYPLLKIVVCSFDKFV